MSGPPREPGLVREGALRHVAGEHYEIVARRRAKQGEELVQGGAACPGHHQGQRGVDGHRREDEVPVLAATVGEALRQAERERRQAGASTPSCLLARPRLLFHGVVRLRVLGLG